MKTCPICTGVSIRPFIKKNGFSLSICPDCYFAAVDAIPDRMTLEKHYDKDYFHGDPKRFGYLDYDAERSNREMAFKSKKKYIEKAFPKGGRLLDIGCADGSFMTMFGPAWETRGVELSKDLVDRMPNALRERVFRGFFEDYPEEREKFDVITLWDVLDHAQNPMAFLAKVNRFLKPNGVVGLITGDLRSLFARTMKKHWYLYVPPAHLSYFSRRSIKKALEKNGLRAEKILYESKPVSLRLIFFRLRSIIPWKPFADVMEKLWNRAPDSIKISINFLDVMTIWARK